MTENGEVRRRDAARTRRDLLAATRELLTEHGTHGMTTRMIAQAAGVNQALVYRYFGSKEALITEAVQARTPELRAAIRSAPHDQIARVIAERLISNPTESDASKLAMLVAASDDEKVRSSVRDGLEGLFRDELGAILGDDDDARLRAELVGAAAVGISFLRTVIGTTGLRAASPEDLVPHVERLLDALMQGHPASQGEGPDPDGVAE